MSGKMSDAELAMFEARALRNPSPQGDAYLHNLERYRSTFNTNEFAGRGKMAREALRKIGKWLKARRDEGYLGPWELIDEGYESLEVAQDEAREIAQKPDSPNRKFSGIGIMVGQKGGCPEWACFGDGDEGYGGWAPTMALAEE